MKKLIFATTLGLVHVVYGTAFTFTNGAGGSTWNTDGNWNVANFPNAVADTATFTTVVGTITSGSAITVDTLTMSHSLGTLNITLSTNTLTVMSTITHTVSVSTISAPVILGSSPVTCNITGGTLTMSGVISDSGSGFGLTKTGGNTLILSGTSANTYTGLTTVSAGTFRLNKTGVNAISTGGITINGGTLLYVASDQIDNTALVTLNTGGTWNLGTFNETIGSFTFNGGTLTQSSGILTLSGIGDALFMGDGTTIPGPLVFSAAGDVVYSGATTVATISGTVDLGTFAHSFNIGNGGSGTDMLVSGVMSGTGASITTVGAAGTLALSAVNTYSGATVITIGTLALSGSGSISASSGVDVSGGTFDISATTVGTIIQDLSGAGGGSVVLGSKTLIFGTGNSPTFDGVISGSGGSIFKQGAGAATFTGVNTHDGSTTINVGSLALSGAGSLAATGAVAVDLAGTFNISALSGPSTTIGSLALSGLLTQGGKTLILSGTGAGTLSMVGTTISGPLAFSAAGGISSFGSAISTISGTVDLGTFAHTFTINDVTGGTDMTVSGVMSGTGASITKSALGVLELSAINTYSGGTTITDGTLALSGSGSIGASSGVDVSGGTFDISATTVSTTIQDLSGVIGGSVVLGSKTLIFGTGNSPTFGGVISGSGGSIFKQGAGAATFTGVNTYDGGTTINVGSLALSGAGSLAATVAVAVASAGTFNISALSGSSTTIGSLALSGLLTQGGKTLILSGTGAGTLSMVGTTISGPLAFSAAGGISSLGSAISTISGTVDLGTFAHTFTINNGTVGTDMLVSGVMSGTGASITKSASGLLELSAVNTYTGATTITFGTLALSGSGSISASSAVNVDGGTFDISATTAGTTIQDLFGVIGGPVVLGSKTLTFGTGNSPTFDGIISGLGGSILKQGAGAATFTGVNTYTGETTINDGSLALTGTGDIGASSAVNVDGGTFDISATTAGTTIQDLSGVGGGSVVLGSKTLTLGTGNSPTFDGIISGSGGSILKQGSGIETFTGVNTYDGGTTINAGQIALSGSGALTSTGTVTVGGSGEFNITLASGARTIGPLAGSGPVFMGTNLLTVNSAGSTSYAGALDGTAGFAKSGSAILTLTGLNTFTGGITVSSGTLALSGTGSVNPSNFVDIASGAFFDLSLLTLMPMPTLTTVAVGNITGSGTLALGANNLTTTTTSDSTFSGTITGTGNLEKAGAAKWSLPSNNAAYLETTTVSAGNLNLNGQLGGAVIVNAGATVSGNGSMGGLTCSGIISTGNSIGILTINGNLIINPGSQTIFEIDPAGNSDLIQVTGTAAVAGEIFIDFTPGVYIEGTMYTAVTAAGGVSGTFFPIVDNNADFTVQLFYFPTFVQLFLKHTLLFFGMTFTDPNAQAVADALELINSSGGLLTDPDLNTIMNSFIGEPTSVIQNALIQMQPSQMSAFSELSAEHGLNLITLLQDRYEMCCKTGCLNCDQNSNIWVTPYGETFNQKPLSRQVGFDTKTYGVAVGGQGVIHHTTLGVALAYDHSTVNWNRGRGHGDVNNAYAGGYVYQREKYYYLGLAALYGHNNYEMARHLKFTTVNRHAKSHFAGNEVIAQATFGLCFKGFLDFNPYADVTYVGSHRNKFKEHGAQSLNLRVHSNWSETMFYDAGIDFKKTYTFGTVCLTPDVKIGWLREDPVSREKYKSRFIDHPQSFKTRGYNKTQNFFTPGFRLTLDVKETWSVSGNYNLQIGPHFLGQNGSIDVKYAF